MASGVKKAKKKVVKKPLDREVQVRMESGELRFFQHFSQAWAFFMNQRQAWKISWTMPRKWGGKRLRIVKYSNYNAMGDPAILGAGFVEDHIAMVERGHMIRNDD